MSTPVGFHNVTFIFQADGATRESTFQIGFDDTAAPLIGPDSVVAAARTAFITVGCPGSPTTMSNQWTFKGCSDAYESEVGTIVYQDLLDVTGTVASQPVPINSALLIRKNSALGGRRNRGRLYCPPIDMTESVVDAIGRIEAGALGVLAAYWTNLHDAFLAADIQPVLFHGAAPFTPTPITSFSLQGTLATQRRRMRK